MISIAIFFVVLIAIWNKNHSFNWFKAKEDKTDTAPKHIENHPKTDIAPKHIQDLATRYLEPISEDHWKSLYRKKRQFIAKDEFGIEDESGQHKWNQEMIRYIDKIILPNAALNDKQLCLDHVRTFNLQASFLGSDWCFKEVLKFFVNATVDFNAEQLSESVDSTRPSEGIAYEHFCCSKFKESGWNARVTQASSDQGCDLIAKIDDITLVVQCKLYSQPVGNKAVQEVVGAMRHYGGTHGAVVTNASFTKSAKALARSNQIYLIHDSEIDKLLAQIRS